MGLGGGKTRRPQGRWFCGASARPGPDAPTVVVELSEDDRSGFLETVAFVGGYGLRLRQLYGAGIVVHSVHEKFVMEMGPRSVASRADVSDNFALPDTGSSADAAGNPGQVQVLRLEGFAVSHHQVVAIGGGTARDAHDSVACRQHRRAHGRGVVDTAVGH